MKKLILLASFFLCSSAFAFPNVYKSTNTSTTEQNAMLCSKRGFVHAVVVSSASAGGALVTLNNSSWTTTTAGSISPIMNSSLGVFNYDTTFPNGLNYSKNGVAQIQILYDCY